MNGFGTLRALRALVWDTFRQSRATKVFWLLTAVSAICVLLCLSIRVDGPRSLSPPGSTELTGPDDKPIDAPGADLGRVSIGFGLFSLNLFRDAPSEVHFLQVLLTKWVAGAIGTLLALIWTAGFLPEALQPATASVSLAKPISRATFLFGKYLGVLSLMTFHAGIFIVGTWLALGARTGVWNVGFLLALPILLAHFTVVYSASVLFAVCTRNTIVCAFGSIAFWGICFGLNFGRHALVALDTVKNPNSSRTRAASILVDVGYWTLPKPADMLMILDRSLDVGAHFEGFATLENAANLPTFSPAWSIAASLAFAAIMFLVSTREFSLTDY